MVTATIITSVLPAEKVYCEWCQIVPISCAQDKYCMACVNDIVEYLAKEWQEQQSIERGWY